MESAINTLLKCGKTAGVDNVPAVLITHGGEPVVEVLQAICKTNMGDGQVAFNMDKIDRKSPYIITTAQSA